MLKIIKILTLEPQELIYQYEEPEEILNLQIVYVIVFLTIHLTVFSFVVFKFFFIEKEIIILLKAL